MGIFISNTLCSRPKVTTWKGNIVLRHYAQLQRHLFNCFLQKCIISLYILIIWGLLVPDRSGLFRILVPPGHGRIGTEQSPQRFAQTDRRTTKQPSP